MASSSSFIFWERDEWGRELPHRCSARRRLPGCCYIHGPEHRMLLHHIHGPLGPRRPGWNCGYQGKSSFGSCWLLLAP